MRMPLPDIYKILREFDDWNRCDLFRKFFNTEDRSGNHEPVNESSRTSGDSGLMEKEG